MNITMFAAGWAGCAALIEAMDGHATVAAMCALLCALNLAVSYLMTLPKFSHPKEKP